MDIRREQGVQDRIRHGLGEQRINLADVADGDSGPFHVVGRDIILESSSRIPIGWEVVFRPLEVHMTPNAGFI
ncbi:glutamate--cysteine ligase [Luteolibacter sp. GHJ8]|uniref:Glutamate--cysteine ligase n=1 Tax=Luteolibacter rhizosphaerae TaxID=2989719 RepID=A0ABT3G9J0_9BACT|nr:glutamate--cysteine ligase [Luteolibacter rhizosphaerae]